MSSNKSAPAPAVAISADIKKWVMWIIIGFAIVFTLSYLVSMVRKDSKQKQSEKAAAVAQTSIPLASAPISKCTTEHPCVLERTDMRTEKVTVPEGSQVCFDPSFWENVQKLGCMTSYKGSEEEKYNCTREEVVSGKCSQKIGDAFRFVLEEEVPLPRYWFTKSGSGGC